jgi:hypothetical protein
MYIVTVTTSHDHQEARDEREATAKSGEGYWEIKGSFL